MGDAEMYEGTTGEDPRLNAELRAERIRLLRGLSHDLKNPLGAVDGYAQLLLEGLKGELNEGQHGLVLKLREAVAAGLGIVEQLSELAVIEAGRAELSAGAVDPAETVRQVVERRAAAAARSEVRLEVAVPPDPPRLRTDPERLRAIVDALLGHALAHAGSGDTVRLDVQVQAPAGGRPQALVVAVRDPGPAVPPDRADRLFGIFSRLEPDLPRGSGLELALARGNARLLGGDIRLIPEGQAQGAHLQVWIPAVGPAATGRLSAAPR